MKKCRIRKVVIQMQMKVIKVLKQNISQINKKMMFCGACTTSDQKQNQLQIRNPLDMSKFKRVSRDNQQLLLSAMKQIGTFSMIVPSQYETQLKKCKQNKTKFMDKQFPPGPSSLNFAIHNRKIVWKRITQIIDNPQLIKGQINPNDINQGNLGDCYFLATIASIAAVPERIYKIFCNQLEICQEGIYRFQILTAGQYKEIIIDDYIPVYEGTNRPVFCKAVGGQAWVMLLEKVWAKLSGSYGSTSAGYPHQVLSTFLISPCFYYEIQIQTLKNKQKKDELWQRIKEGSQRNMPMVAGSRQAYTCKGFKPAHSYSILQGFQVQIDAQSFRLLKLRNPWGDTQYIGRFSEHDKQFWNKVDKSRFMKFVQNSQQDGIFTIDFDQFIRNFQCLDISHDIPNYNYFYLKENTKSKSPCFFKLKIQSNSSLQCYITIEKAFDREQYVKTRRVEYGYSRILIAKIKQTQINGKIIQSYEYVDSIMEPNFPDITIRQKYLNPGEYIVMAETQFPNLESGNFSISVYSQSVLNLQRIQGPDLFLHKVLTNHGHRASLSTRSRLSESGQDWMISNFMFKQGGYGYLLVCLGPNSTQRVQISGHIRKIQESGFILLERKDKQQIKIVIQPNQQAIVIFGIDFTQNISSIRFPPKGIRVARII